MNLFTGAVIAVLVMLSIILTASVLFPEAMNETVMLSVLGGGTGLAALIAIFSGAFRKTAGDKSRKSIGRWKLDNWRMPPLAELPPPQFSYASRIWMGVLRILPRHCRRPGLVAHYQSRCRALKGSNEHVRRLS